MNKLLKQFGRENWVYPFALIGRKETRHWGLCPGQREHAQHPGALESFLTVLILPAWQDTMAYTNISFPPDRCISSEALLFGRHWSLLRLQALALPALI